MTMMSSCALVVSYVLTRIIMAIGTTKVQMAAEVGVAFIQQLDEQKEQLQLKLLVCLPL